MTTIIACRKRPLTFELRVIPAADQSWFGVELAEFSASNGSPGLRIGLDEKATARIMTSLQTALKESKLKPAGLSPTRQRPIKLTEASGVRLALAAIGTAPLSRRSRVAEVEEGVAAMSTEEAYYWYAKCTGRSAARSRRALRLLLADE